MRATSSVGIVLAMAALDGPAAFRDADDATAARQRGVTMKTRLVVADDSALYLELLVLVFEAVPELEVVGAAADGREAVRLALEHAADAALLDVEMPVLDGFAAAEEIRRLRPKTELFLHTGRIVRDERRRGAQLGLDVFDKLDLARTVELIARLPSRRHTA
jgi:DNA-binding NarL/FixJ family response regulator